MKLTSPYIKTLGAAKKAYNELILNYVKEYNKNKPLREQLRDVHITLYHSLIELLRQQINADNVALKRGINNPEQAINPANPYPFNTNNGYLQSISKGVNSRKTIYNRLKRLIEAGVVEKEGHGTYRDFTLLINPDLVYIWDFEQPDFNPVLEKSLSSENQHIAKNNSVNFTDVSVLTDYTLNKKISDVGYDVEKGVRLSPHDFNFTQIQFHRYTPKQVESPEKPLNRIDNSEKKPEKKEKSCAKKEKKARGEGWNGSRFSKEWWVNLWVKQFYALLIAHLFKNHNIYDFERQRTLDFIRNHFAGFTTIKQGISAMAQYRWRVQAAARWVRTHNYDISNVYPYAYLTGERTTGKFSFDVTRQYWLKHLDYIWDREKRAKAYKKKYNEQNKLHAAIAAYLKEPNLSAFRKYELYVKNNIPHLLAQFYAGIGIDVQTGADNSDNLNINPKSNNYETQDAEKSAEFCANE